jgi:DNA-binding FadR family transcriptional regulator
MNRQHDRSRAVSSPEPGGTRTEKVAIRLARTIVHRLADLPLGANLPSEAEMIESYGVSRGSVREALRILEVQGLITIRPGPGGGPVLVGPQSIALGKTQTLFFHLLRARYAHLLHGQAALEPLMARLAANNPDRAQLRDLERHALPDPTVTDAVVDGAAVDDGDRGVGVDRADGLENDRPDEVNAFHTALIAASGNPILTLLCQSVRDITLARIDGADLAEPGERRLAIAEHAAIARAILAGDAELAERLMTAHMDSYCAHALTGHAGLVDEIVDWH